MSELYEKQDSLNNPIESFIFDAAKEAFPVKPHWHYFAEFIYIYSGSAVITSDNDAYTVSQGELIILYPSSVHLITSADGKPILFAGLKFDPVKFPDSSSYAPSVTAIFRYANQKAMQIHFSKQEADSLGCKGIFEECESLKTLPDISKWNTNNVTTLDGVFNCCKSLISLPDISKWNTNNVTSMRFLFQSCFSLTTLPDISKWNTEKVTTMQATFNLCISLTELPDISKWNTSNVTNMVKLFNMCEKLQSFPNIFTWDTSKVMNNTQMFNHCYAAVLLLAGNNLIQ